MSQFQIKERFSLTKILWKRKLYYVFGYLCGLLIGLLNIGLGSKIDFSELIILPLSSSFLLGFLFYLMINEPEKLKRQGRTVIFSKEGLIHFALSLSILIVSAFINRILK